VDVNSCGDQTDAVLLAKDNRFTDELAVVDHVEIVTGEVPGSPGFVSHLKAN
jgi:hypothetical protein